MDASITVVVPALDEARRLPVVLGALARQTLAPALVVVADGGSRDATREVALAAGAVVAEGGTPAVGRNAGARLAKGDLLLFLDADVDFDDDALRLMVSEFAERDLVAASAYVEPLERDVLYSFACDVVNLYLEVMQYVQPHAPGCCILVRRDLHEAIGGFDETLALAEDHDYARRAGEAGRFRMLRSAAVRTSMRRLDSEGLPALAFKYLYSELRVLTGQRMTEVPFEYEFAAFGEDERRPRQVLEPIRDRLAAFSETLGSLSAEGLEALRLLAGAMGEAAPADRALRGLRAEDLRALRGYLAERLRLARESVRPRGLG